MISLYILALFFCGVTLLLPWLWRRKATTEVGQRGSKLCNQVPVFSQDEQTTADKVDPYQDIQALVDFDWQHEQPVKLRPFKPKYHLTMSLERTTLSDLIAIDKTYASRIALRRSIAASNRRDILAALPGTTAMVHELYTWLFTTYLPMRVPTMFSLQPATPHVSPYNHVLSEHIPFPPPWDPEECLSIISAHVDTDFLLLAPRPPSPSAPTTAPGEHDDKYHLLAFANCFPSGFSPRDKLGLPLNEIHGPVPGYATRLERSMDRFFARIGRGEIVKRANWTVTTSGEEDLFCLKGNHFKRDEDGDGGGLEEGAIERQRQEVDVAACRLRAERQTLHRLPESGALVFAFKTYLYPLDEVKAEEGIPEALSEAIQGLGRGNVPEMKVYKRQVVWGEKVREYLLS